MIAFIVAQVFKKLVKTIKNKNPEMYKLKKGEKKIIKTVKKVKKIT